MESGPSKEWLPRIGETRGEHYKEIKAGNDLKMANGFPERVKRAMDLGELDRKDLEHCAKRILELILKLD